MAKNTALNKATIAKEDEFYTQLSDIEKELRHYKEHFKDKIVFCNCDDPETSKFLLYFQLNFYVLGIKKLIATHYEIDKPSYKLEIVASDIPEDGQLKLPEYIKTPLKQNGDFRSPECVEILKEADIVVTNPPFSLFREYLAQLMEYNKDFLIIGNINCITYKEVFPLIQDNRIWFGYCFNKTLTFRMSDTYLVNSNGYVDKDGHKFGKVPGICWFTNLDIDKRNEKIILYKKYNENEYPRYVNYDAIEVGKVSDIPVDFYDKMGVPLTFLDRYNPEQFKIIGFSLELANNMKDYANKGEYMTGGKRFYIKEKNGSYIYKRLYDRVVIIRVVEEE